MQFRLAKMRTKAQGNDNAKDISPALTSIEVVALCHGSSPL